MLSLYCLAVLTNVLAIGAAVSTEAPDMNAERPHHLEETAVGVDYRGKNTVKSVQNEKYSAKSADFLRFLLYLCHVIDDFDCLDLQH